MEQCQFEKKKLQKSFYTHMRRYFLQFEKSYLAKLWLKHLFFLHLKVTSCVLFQKNNCDIRIETEKRNVNVNQDPQAEKKVSMLEQRRVMWDCCQ